jgi:hypothetical protein
MKLCLYFLIAMWIENTILEWILIKKSDWVHESVACCHRTQGGQGRRSHGWTLSDRRTSQDMDPFWVLRITILLIVSQEHGIQYFLPQTKKINKKHNAPTSEKRNRRSSQNFFVHFLQKKIHLPSKKEQEHEPTSYSLLPLTYIPSSQPFKKNKIQRKDE